MHLLNLSLTQPEWIAVFVVMFAAALAHGTFGFGFPAISIPVIAMFTDIKTTILINLLPNLAVNLISVLRGGGWRGSIGRHWPIVIFIVIGSFIGARYLIYASEEPLRLLLAGMIVVYLCQNRFSRINWGWFARYPKGSTVGFGLVAGFFSGSVNFSVPPLLIWAMLFGLDAMATTQVLNLCFLVGRSMQAGTLAVAGVVDLDIVIATVPLVVVAIVGLAIGQRLRARFSPATYRRLLHGVLWVSAAVLAAQAIASYLR
jgi:uncharacterized membrane protein YfcA